MTTILEPIAEFETFDPSSLCDNSSASVDSSSSNQSHDDEYHMFKSTESEKESRPRLMKRNAFHIKTKSFATKTKTSAMTNEHSPNFEIIHKYKHYNYYQYYKFVNAGFIREVQINMNLNETMVTKVIPISVIDLCSRYGFSEKDGLFQMGYFLSCILEKLGQKNLAITLGFKGDDIINELRKYVKGLQLFNDQQMFDICNKLLLHKYIKPINGSHNAFGGIFDSMFSHSMKYEYNYHKTHSFTEYMKFLSVYDRLSWNIGCQIQIYSSQSIHDGSNGGWIPGVISEIDPSNKKITVIFKSIQNGQLLRKTLNRFDPFKVRSTAQYIENRLNWNIGCKSIEIYSHSKHRWFPAEIISINIPDPNKPYIDQIKVEYEYNSKVYSKSVARFSSDIRQIQCNQLQSNDIYQSGTLVMVYSNSKQKWIAGHIKVVIPIANAVIVKYAKSEKIVDISSNKIRLLS